MKKLKDFKTSIATVRMECVGRSRMNRTCPERLVPYVSTFLDDTMQAGYKKFFDKDGGYLVERYCWLVCFVVDVFTDHKNDKVTDEQYDLFVKYMEQLRKLRDEIMESYDGTGKPMDEMRDKVICFWDLIRSSSHWEMFSEHTLFDNPIFTYEALKRLNNDWDELQKVVGDVRSFYLNFSNFSDNRHKFDMSYNEEELYQIFFDILDGKKKLSEPIKMYKVVGTTYAVVDANESSQADYGILVPNDSYYQATKYISIAVMKTIKGMGQSDDNEESDE